MGKFDLSALIASAGPKGSKSETLEEWLRDEFFEQHCALFHHRPFIWHIWDGHKSGFSALVNYHQLTHANLEKLTYAYLGDWIRRQQAAVDAGEAGSDARLQAAKQLQSRLKLILEGEPPYDLFVRWKPLSKQAIGWHPDINDGVRMNIRPFRDIGGRQARHPQARQTSSGTRIAARSRCGTRKISRGSGAGMRRSKTLPESAKSRTAIAGTTATTPMSSRSGRGGE